MGVLLGNTFLRFARRGMANSAGTGTRESDRSRRLVDAAATASGSCISRLAGRLGASTLSPRILRGSPPRGAPPETLPPFSPNTIRRQSEECSSACSMFPTERSVLRSNRQSCPDRLAGQSVEFEREAGRCADSDEGTRDKHSIPGASDILEDSARPPE
jgi:hypothetical protein